MSLNLTSCLSGANAVTLSSNICNPGFYCTSRQSAYDQYGDWKLTCLLDTGLNNTEEHPPTYCAPTSECLITRLQAVQNTCHQPQGLYEPIVCRPGYYCPLGGKKQLVCPKGHYCPLGNVEPFECKKLSRCPEGSDHEIPFLGFLVCGLLDLFLVCLFLWPHIKRRPNREERGNEPGSQVSHLEMQPAYNCQSGPADWLDSLFSEESINVGMDLEFRNVSLCKPKSTEFILSEVNGKAQASSLTGIMGQSGSGKSRYQPTREGRCETDYFRPIATLVNILVGKVRATSGTLFLNGVEKKLAKYASQSQ